MLMKLIWEFLIPYKEYRFSNVIKHKYNLSYFIHFLDVALTYFSIFLDDMDPVEFYKRKSEEDHRHTKEECKKVTKRLPTGPFVKKSKIGAVLDLFTFPPINALPEVPPS